MTTRFFSFGCSFTNYGWPTWADIVSREFDEFENWGQMGAGNHYIFFSLLECLSRNNVTKDDTIGIMWTSTHREDRWIKGQWKVMGSIFSSQLPKEYIDNFCDSNHFLLTSVSLIDAAKRILDSIGCRYWFFSMVPLTDEYDPASHRVLNYIPDFEREVLALFQPALSQVCPSVFEVIFKKDWNTDAHIKIPSTQRWVMDRFREDYNAVAQPNWPSFEKFFADDCKNIDSTVLDALENQHNFITRRRATLYNRQDAHPYPAEHAQYLEHMGWILTPNQKSFVDFWQDKVLTKEEFKWMSKPFKRFGSRW